jgi:hypothetical protein
VLVSFVLTACSSSTGTLGTSSASRIHNDLTGMACPTSSLCFAVGYDGPYVPNGHVLIERWNGSSYTAALRDLLAGF